ncbi:MAG: hypothetical protein ABI379_01525 [Rhodanobacter sp.]
MDQKVHAILQRLIIELDDTGSLYSAMGRMLTSPRPKYVVQRIVLAHCAIADDLVEHALMLGAQRVRRGSMLGRLHARCGAWWTTTGADVELGCLLHVERREARIVTLFCAAAEHAPGLQQRLHHHLGELQYVSAQVAFTLDGMDTRSHQVSLLAAGAAGGRPTLETSNLPNQPLADEPWPHQEPGEKADRSVGPCGAESADAVQDMANTRPRMNRRKPSFETPISARDDHTASVAHLVTRVRPFPQAFGSIRASADTHRFSSVLRPAHQSADPETDALRPWDRPGKFYEQVRHPSPLRVVEASTTLTPVRVERFVTDDKHAIPEAQNADGVNQVETAVLESTDWAYGRQSHVATRVTVLGTKAKFEEPS